MKKGWEVKTLNQISENLDNKRIPITKNKRKSGIYPYYGASGIVDYVNDYIFDENLLLISEDGANLLARSTPIAFSVSGKIWVNNHAHILKFKNIITQKYVEMFFESIKLDKYITGAAQPKLNQSALNSIPIPIPPISEQQEIVRILDEAFDGINTIKANTEKNLQNARELFESYLQNIFANPGIDWEVKKLGEVCNLITDGTHQTPTYLTDGIPFLSVKNLTQGFIDFSNTRFISLEEHKFLTKRCQPEKEDILYTKVGTTGIAKVVDTDREFSIFVSVALLKIKHELIFNRCLEYFLNSPFARKQAKKRTRGMANKNLVIRDIKEIEIYFPKSLAEQKAIVEKLDQLSTETKRLEKIYQQKLTDLEELKKSILQKAFNGELT